MRLFMNLKSLILLASIGSCAFVNAMDNPNSIETRSKSKPKKQDNTEKNDPLQKNLTSESPKDNSIEFILDNSFEIIPQDLPNDPSHKPKTEEPRKLKNFTFYSYDYDVNFYLPEQIANRIGEKVRHGITPILTMVNYKNKPKILTKNNHTFIENNYYDNDSIKNSHCYRLNLFQITEQPGYNGHYRNFVKFGSLKGLNSTETDNTKHKECLFNINLRKAVDHYKNETPEKQKKITAACEFALENAHNDKYTEAIAQYYLNTNYYSNYFSFDRANFKSQKPTLQQPTMTYKDLAKQNNNKIVKLLAIKKLVDNNEATDAQKKLLNTQTIIPSIKTSK